MSSYHLAEFNISHCRAPLDTPAMSGFVEQLETLNALADESLGFVWRFKTEEGNATSVRPYDDPLIIVNLSVWESVETLRSYAYRSHHAEVYRRRKEWFQNSSNSTLVLWWTPAGTLPDVEEGRRRLERLAAHGPTPESFTFRSLYSPPDYAGHPRPQ